MIYDCVTLFNELEMLELRMHELNNVVDRFVIVESDITHSGISKPLYFKENRERFKKFERKIIHGIAMINHPTEDMHRRGRWDQEINQKNSILSFIDDKVGKGDILIISDIDEIPMASKLKEAIRMEPCMMYARFYQYHLNDFVGPDSNLAPVIITYERLKSEYGERCHDAKVAASQKQKVFNYLPDSAWHFSYLGGRERIIQKMNALTFYFNVYPYCLKPQQIEELKRPERIDRVINKGLHLITGNSLVAESVDIDESFPRYLCEHREKFEHLIRKREDFIGDSQAKSGYHYDNF
jgi:beta-1,4-mannosyl-glycoprotein beta-1,4-N-acetylglucosaminyltransferase